VGKLGAVGLGDVEQEIRLLHYIHVIKILAYLLDLILTNTRTMTKVFDQCDQIERNFAIWGKKLSKTF
jgi:hypothetical protein